MNNSGVYEIKRTKTGDRYAGSSADVHRRLDVHCRALRGEYHINSHLQNAWNKYGENAFEFNVLLYCDPELLLVFEQLAIDQSGHYNLSPTAGNNLGIKHTEEAKTNMSASQTGNQNALGCTRSDETRARLSKARMGRKTSAETRAKQSAALMGREFSDEHRAKISDALTGREFSDGHKAKISAAAMGRKHTDEAKAKMSATRKGKPWSAARRASWEGNE